MPAALRSVSEPPVIRRFSPDDGMLETVAAALKTTPAEIGDRVEGLVDERRKLEREVTELRKKLALAGDGAGQSGGSTAREVGGVSFLGRVLEGVSAKDLKGLVDEAKGSLGSGVVVFAGVADGKASVVVGVTPDLTDRFNAVDLVRAASEAIGGKGGGGRPDMAQAGGPDAANAGAAIDAVEKALGSQSVAA